MSCRSTSYGDQLRQDTLISLKTRWSSLKIKYLWCSSSMVTHPHFALSKAEIMVKMLIRRHWGNWEQARNWENGVVQTSHILPGDLRSAWKSLGWSFDTFRAELNQDQFTEPLSPVNPTAPWLLTVLLNLFSPQILFKFWLRCELETCVLSHPPPTPAI